MGTNTYPNYRCYSYHLYGDNSGKEYSFRELTEYFAIDGSEYTCCIKNKIGDAGKCENFSFCEGNVYQVMRTSVGTFIIR